MDIRSAIVDGVRIFSTNDLCTILGIDTQSLRCVLDPSQSVYFHAKRSGDDTSRHLSGFPFCEIKRVLEKRLKRDRIGSNLVPSILEWMATQSDLKKVEIEPPAAPDFTKMTPEEIYDAGLMDEFLEFATNEKAKKGKRNEALKAIKDAKDLLESLN